jgi:hypothetical protein
LKIFLSKNLSFKTKALIVESFTSFINNYTCTDSASNTDISKYISKLINLAFNVVNSENIKLKKTGFSLIIELVKKF